MDQFMNRFIIVGGLAVIFAVFGIFFFILVEVMPLFDRAEVTLEKSSPTHLQGAILIGADEWMEHPFIVSKDGSIHFLNTETGSITDAELEKPDHFSVQSWAYHQNDQTLITAGDSGTYILTQILYKPIYAQDGSRKISAQTIAEKANRIAPNDQSILSIDFEAGKTMRTIAAISQSPNDLNHHVTIQTFERKRSLFGAGKFSLSAEEPLDGDFPANPIQLLVGTGGESLIIRLENQTIQYWKKSADAWQLEQSFTPFTSKNEIVSMDFIQGKVSINLTSDEGENIIFSLTPTKKGLQFVQTKSLETLDSGADVYAHSVRNKAFLIANETSISLRYATTEAIRWESSLDTPIVSALIGGKYDKILTLAESGDVRFYNLIDHHPEAGFKAYFSKIWYEGQSEPKFVWQSTGGSDDFEPKLSLIPLIAGSLKGTFYALLFAVPIALMAAVYTSQFLKPELKRIIKPTMEIMASLPSVVLGFLGALWLAPILEQRIPSVILICIAIPAAAIIVGYAWNQFPVNIRVLIPHGLEFVVFFPILCIVSYVAWISGPLFEQFAFTVNDPVTGGSVADFRLWWTDFTGSDFQQRNSLVVGFMMGFAVIPLIFTIAEDALSNVPPTLVAGSLALGASRWQTTARVILPTASAGIFSALMIGLGRAVGETMIVVMATGNTPIMDLNIFSGMRTLSANIAVELPEAPHGATLYRTLFLGALVLFMLTFLVNTVAEVMRNRLRNRYKVIN